MNKFLFRFLKEFGCIKTMRRITGDNNRQDRRLASAGVLCLSSYVMYNRITYKEVVDKNEKSKGLRFNILS